MHRRDISKALFATAAGSAVVAPRAQAQTCIAPCYAQTAAEVAVSVTPTNPQYAPLKVDIRRYGADPTGAAASDSAMLQAITVCGAAGLNGGTIWLPAGTYLFNSPWVATNGITFVGDGSATGGAQPGTLVKYAGTGSAHFIQLTGTGGCRVQAMQITNTSNSFTGAMIGAASSSLTVVQDVVFNASGSCYHIELDKGIEFTAERCNFAGGALSISGQSAAGASFCNIVRFRDCQWIGCAITPVCYGGESWSFDGCTWEALSNGKAGAFGTNVNTPSPALTFRGCWFGDVSVSGGIWIVLVGSPGFSFIGNYISGEVTNTYAMQLQAVGGATIAGNNFALFDIGINLAGGTTSGLVVQGNNWNSVTSPISGSLTFGSGPGSIINPNNPNIGSGGGLAPYFSPAAIGWEYSQNGLLEVWGETTFAAGTGATVAFSSITNFPGFHTAVWNLCISTISPATPGAFAYASAPTTSGFSLNATGSGDLTCHWRAKGK